MQPSTDHRSTGVEYRFCPNKISGALYHKVTTCAAVVGSPFKKTDYHLMRVYTNRNSKRPSRTKVGQLETSVAIDQQVGRLEVPVKDPACVTVSDAAQDLKQVALCCFQRKGKSEGGRPS